MRRVSTFVRSLVVAGILGLPASALALTCDEVMNMVNLNIPPNIVADTVRNAADVSDATTQCLISRGAPTEVIEAAKKKARAAEAMSTPTPDTTSEGEEGAAIPSFEDEEALGGMDFSGGDVPADEAEPDGETYPAAIAEAIQSYRSNKPATAAQNLYRLLRDGVYPKQEDVILHYLAKSLFDLEMYHAAQHYHMEVVRKGPSTRFFKLSLAPLVAIAELTGNDYELLRIVQKIPPEAFPRQARNHLYYLMGRRLFDKEDLKGATAYFEQVSGKSPLYMRAKYYEGVLNQQRQRLRSSVQAYREVISATPEGNLSSRRVREIEDLKDLAYIQIARIYFGLERFDNADTYYSMVDRDSTYWPQSMFERAWTNFWKADLNYALGLLLTVQSPYFADDEFIPEVQILRALTFFNFCEYQDVDRELTLFERQYKPMQVEVEEFINKYKGSKELWDKAYEAYFEADHAGSAASQAMFARVLRNRDLAAFVDHLQMMDDELASIETRPAAFRQGVGDQIKRVIEADRIAYKKRAGAELLRELVKVNKTLKNLLVQSEIIKFEVVDALRTEYEFRAQNFDDLQAGEQAPPDFAVSKEIIYWPFNGEFWRDELGYYRYTENGSCQ